ncbi:YbjO family protein [Pantoea alhagi]|uniref:YbjO family protein n=1 Tax=Pantoea alhagi TaxID=1891675 RepID=UPI00202B7C26|nr:YbjO family protein [Pantoea alhagi]URQ62013.1 YbjO family protein [Pantoea alhagi]
MSEVFRFGKAAVRPQQAPVPVMIAGQAIIATRCISVLLLVNELGYDGIADFIHRSAQAWDSTLIFVASQMLFFIELRCALTLMRGSRRGRLLYALSQAVVLLYLWAASIGWIYPEIFSISGASNGEIFHRLILHKSPDLLVLLMLFLPASSRQFFQRR